LIKPEDHRGDVQVAVGLPAGLLDRLEAYADSLKDTAGQSSSTGYVIRAILDKELPQIGPLKAKPKTRGARA